MSSSAAANTRCCSNSCLKSSTRTGVTSLRAYHAKSLRITLRLARRCAMARLDWTKARRIKASEDRHAVDLLAPGFAPRWRRPPRLNKAALRAVGERALREYQAGPKVD